MRRLSNAPELMDGQLDGPALVANLRDLTRVNRWLGGADLSWRALRPILESHSGAAHLRLLDVGTGAADIPRELLRRASHVGAKLAVTATDIRPEIVEVARRASTSVDGVTIELDAADAIGAGDASFDVAHASLVLHHLEPAEARRLLAEMSRVAPRAVIVNDLERGLPWLTGAWVLSRTLTGNRYTRHDAPLSVRRAYTASEMADLGTSVGLRLISRYRARPPYRYALVFRAGSRSG